MTPGEVIRLSDLVCDIENEKGSAMPALQTPEDTRETYPYFFLRDGAKVLAESAEAKEEFERLKKLAGHPVDRFNFYRVKGDQRERRTLPNYVNNQEYADRIFRFICDGDSNWSAFLTQACKAGGGSYLPEGFMYHVNIERGKKEIQAAAEKLLDWNEGRLLCKAMAHHLWGINNFARQYRLFTAVNPTALQREIVERGISVALWLIQMNVPIYERTGVNLPALNRALVEALHALAEGKADKASFTEISKAGSLFHQQAGVLPPKPPAMSDPRRVHYYPLKDRGRTTVMTAAEGMKSIHDAFQQYQHGNDTYLLTDEDFDTLAKWKIDLKQKAGRDRLSAILIEQGVKG